MERLIFHVDVNSAFLSWEAVRRISDGNEDIRLIPSAISGDPANRTGVILAKSIPAKQYGIRTGEPVGMALKKCPDLFLARPDFKLYEKNSRAFMDICRRYAPVVEKFSIDECFLDMTGTDKLYPNPIEIAYRIKEEIKEKLGFTVNVGAGPNKLLAKMASDMEKPDKVHTLFISQIQEKLWPLPVRELYSVGRATAQKLEKAGIRTIGELANAFLPFLQSLLGKKAGKQLHEYANGIDFSPVMNEPEEAKGYSVSAQCISVCIRSRDFKNRSRQRRLDKATDITDAVYRTAKELLRELWQKQEALRLLGISLMQITRSGSCQMTLFGQEERERARKLDKTVDDIRSKYGMDKIKRGSSLINPISVGKKYRAHMENELEEEI